MSEIQSFISINTSEITKGEDPEGKCDDWNDQLANKLTREGWHATVIAEPKVPLLNKMGNPIGHHAITVAYSSEKKIWIASDLSAPQIEGIEDIFFVESDSLTDLAKNIRDFYGGNWKVLDNEKMLILDTERRTTILAQRKRHYD